MTIVLIFRQSHGGDGTQVITENNAYPVPGNNNIMSCSLVVIGILCYCYIITYVRRLAVVRVVRMETKPEEANQYPVIFM